MLTGAELPSIPNKQLIFVCLFKAYQMTLLITLITEGQMMGHGACQSRNLRYQPGIGLKGLRKNHKNLSPC